VREHAQAVALDPQLAGQRVAKAERALGRALYFIEGYPNDRRCISSEGYPNDLRCIFIRRLKRSALYFTRRLSK
jgi:hypothetical protein